MSSENYIFETKDLCKSYGKIQVLKKLNMHVPKGSIYGFVGKNGAGKTTLIRILCGLQYQNSGDCVICGVQNTDPSINNIRKKFGAIVETPSLHLNMTAYQNVELQMHILGIKDNSRINELLEFVGLSDAGKKIAANFSLGMKQRLAIAIALCGKPELLILDEPMNGLDPQGIIDMRELLLKVNNEMGITILISSHILDELSKVATHYGFLSNGSLVSEVSVDELMSDDKHSMTLKLSTSNGVEKAMDAFDNKYELENDIMTVYGTISVTALVLSLDKHGVEVLRIDTHDETLEEHFFELIGGENNG